MINAQKRKSLTEQETGDVLNNLVIRMSGLPDFISHSMLEVASKIFNILKLSYSIGQFTIS